MESDGMKNSVDHNSDDCSSNSHSDDLQENQAKEFNAGHNVEATKLKSIIELSADEILSMEFDSHEKAYEFYVKYAKCVGFDVRKGDVARDENGNMIRRKFVCNKAGLRDKKHYMRIDRKREHKPETRTNCNARLMVYLDKNTSTWKVSRFEKGHNHELIPVKFDHLLPNYCQLTNAEKEQIDSMHGYGIQTFQIMGFMAGQARGYAGVGFSKKDLYNYIDKQRHAKITDGDALAAISYLQGKADSDPMMFARYTTVGDQLGNLFWADGLSRVDYEYFGDVVAFDMRYKENKYHKPLVIFSGTNHHRQTCIFAYALLVDKGVDAYKWVFENFLDAMQKKQPSVVVTDDEEAISEVIKAVFPNATHRLCAWHLQKNATSNIKNTEFCEAFKKSIDANFDPDEFEEYWDNMIQKFEVRDNKWVQETYKRKEMWATTYLRDKFCAGVRITSRCEGINSFIKRCIKSRHSILELVQHFELAVKEYRNNELVAEFNSMYNEPVLTTALESIERGAANVYTRDIFKDVKKELEGAAALFVVGCENIATTATYKLTKFRKPGCEFKVIYDKNSKKFDCQCSLWNTHGIPCSHIFCVMVHEHIEELPEKMILRRWTKAAKSYREPPNEEEDNDKMFLLRYGALCSASNWMSFLAARKLHDFLETRDEICRMTTKLEHKCCVVDIGSSSIPKNMVGDSIMVNTKDAPPTHKNVKKKRHCSHCDTAGHVKRNCPRVKDRKSQLCEDDLSSSSTSDDPPDVFPATNNEVEHTPIDLSTSMRQSHALKHAATTSGFGIRGPQFFLPGPSQPCFAANVGHEYLASQGVRYFPLAPAQQHFIRPSQALVQQFVPQGVDQQYVRGPSHQHQGLAQNHSVKGHGH